jgi:coenzyme Q-binding protein COQ10
MPGATKSIVINAPMEKVFDVIADFDKYPQFLPEVKECKVLNRKGAECDVQYKVDVMKTIQYTIHAKEERPSRVSWTFIKGEMMKDNQGSWVLENAGDGKTKVTYSIEMSLGPLVPKTIVNALVETSLPKMLEAFKKRAESA